MVVCTDPDLKVLVVAVVGAPLVRVEYDGAYSHANVKTCGAISSKICRGFTVMVLAIAFSAAKAVGAFCTAEHRKSWSLLFHG